MSGPSFDRLSSNYGDLLRDPVRDRFTGPNEAFFHFRKRDLIYDYFRRKLLVTSDWRYLDLGCGQGTLLSLLRGDFAHVAGCDPSAGMLASVAAGIETRRQENDQTIPFSDGEFDFVTAVCVFHHVPLAHRPGLTREIARVLRPGGIFCLIEHNPANPVTRRIVSRTPVDADAILLPAAESRRMVEQAGMEVDSQSFFLYLPAPLYRRVGFLERLLSKIPLGGQYAVFARKS